jgi:uncharacterized protein YdeI (YjbR/CyaY-like superfamily)
MVSFDDKPIIHADTVAEWERFLDSSPDDGGVRLRLRKKASTKPGIVWLEAVEVALCFGWIDGQSKSLDEDYTLQAFTPRRARSPWSQVNRDHVARLTTDGRMRPGGLAEVERAKADGRWDAAYRQKGAVHSDEFQAALDASPAASAFYETISKQNRFAMIFRLSNMKLPANRTKRIAEYIAMLERGETLH